MTDHTNDGGPAFPHPALANESFCPSYDMGGMSLRDWFAGQALAGLLASGQWHNFSATGTGFAELIVEHAFSHADAMIAARAAK